MPSNRTNHDPRSPVADDELLYRSVRPRDIPRVNGEYQISSQAFQDRNRQPSVDRAKLCGSDPSRTRMGTDDAVVSVLALQVRQITVHRNDEHGRPIREHVADVRPDPREDNPAHAVIYGKPEFDHDKTFRRLLERLAQIASVELPPRQG